VPEGRELGQLIRMLEEHGAEAIPCPMIAIRDAPDAEPVRELSCSRPIISPSNSQS
jgi:uroporphyrinogen-III synthase